MRIFAAILQLSGAGLLVAGVGCLSLPVAVITAGLIVTGLGLAVERGADG